MDTFLKQMTELDGLSGNEHAVCAAIEQQLDGRFQYTVDRIGNLYAHTNGYHPDDIKLMITAHMDEVGMIVKAVTDEGYIKFDTVGGLDERILPGQRVTVGNKKITGVIGSLAIHLQTKEQREQITPLADLFVDIGATSREQALEYISIGDCIAFAAESEQLGDLVKAKALDDRVGCITLLKLLEQAANENFTAVFTTREEIGCVGAKAAAGAVKPKYAIVLEGTTASDIGETPDEDTVCKVGSGPVLSFMDRATIYDRKFLELAKTVAERENIPYQIKRAVAGGNEAGCIQRSSVGCRVLVISLPCRYIHGPVSVASEEDMDNMLRLAHAIVKELK